MKNRGWAKYWGDWLKTGFITAFLRFDKAKNSSIRKNVFSEINLRDVI